MHRGEKKGQTEQEAPIRIATISNSVLVHDLLCQSVEQQCDISFVGSIVMQTLVKDDRVIADETLQNCEILLIHLYALEMPILPLLQQLRRAAPAVSILVFGLEPDTQLILSCLEGGAAAYSLETDTIDTLLAQIRALWRGEPIVAPLIAAALIGRLHELTTNQRQHDGVSQSKLDELTSRELEVLGLLKRGYSNRAIAEALILEIGTVKNHVHHILQKLNLGSRRAAMRYAQLMEKVE